MLNKLINSLVPNYNGLKNRTVFLLLFAVAFFVRLPFFFRDYIDRDESTFILIGQSWVNGHLPYTDLWDVKPPLTFLFFAGIIYVFGKSFIAIRFIGTLLVTITTFFTYKIGEDIGSKKIGFWSAIGCVALQSMFGSLQGVMSEHITMAFFMPALYLLIKHQKFYWYGVAGLLMGLTVMVKLNMAYAILFLGLYQFYVYLKKKEFWVGTRNVTGFGTGIILIIALTILPYYLQGNTELWWKSVVQAPLEYADARRYSILKLAPIGLVLAGFFLFAWKKKYLDFRETAVQILVVAIVGVVLSFIKGGRVNGHYLIQLHPILIVLVGIVVSKIPLLQKANYRPYVFFLLLLLPVETYLEYAAIIKNKIEKGSFFNGEGITVPKYLMENNINTKNILFTEYHIGYWVLGANPPTKAATHPSNICKPEMFPFYDNPRKTALEELQFILRDVQPKIIVTRKNKSIFDKKLIEENEYINAYLGQYYTPIKTLDNAQIYQRLEGL